jgi:hypothetical protein
LLLHSFSEGSQKFRINLSYLAFSCLTPIKTPATIKINGKIIHDESSGTVGEGDATGDKEAGCGAAIVPIA